MHNRQCNPTAGTNVDLYVHSTETVSMCRYLGESPANLCTPAYVAAAAQSIAEAAPDVMRLEVHSPSDLHCQWACKDGAIAHVCGVCAT